VHDLVLNSKEPLGQGFRPRWAARNIDVDGNDFVHAFTDRVGELEKAAAIGAASHRDDVFRIRHLVIQELGPLGHFVSQRPGHDHEIRLPRRGARNRAEAINVGSGSARLHQLDGATGQPKEHIPLRRRSPPVKQVVYLRRKNRFRQLIQ
jgi:hypothetical protein